MFSYYGSKSKIVHLYPKPKHDKIIEPFAGSARYALRYFDRDVLLVDKYEVIVKIWKWLQQCSEQDILGLPRLKKGESLENYNLSEVERDFLGFIVTRGVESPRHNVSSFVGDITPKLVDVSKKVSLIRHWKIELGNYENIPNQSATWFIDPPYQFGGEWYVEGNKPIDFQELGKWCQSRNGQSIVCENTKADWLPFYPLTKIQGTIHKTTEAIWSNERHNFMSTQPPLFVE